MRRYLPIPNWVWLACLVLAVLKLWLTAGQAVFAVPQFTYDDMHYLIQASHLLQGEWLGPYNQLTLIKGPFFPAWIAIAFLAGVPLLLSTQILYAAACWLLSLAVRPLLNRNIYTPSLYAFLLFSPASAGLTRVLRELISPGLTVFVAACATGLLLAREGHDRRASWWAVGLGVSFAALWLTREEEVVVLPFLVFVFGCALFLALRPGNARKIWHVARMWLLSFLVWAVIVYSVAAINLVRYGLFAKTEFDAHSFNAALGALARVKPAEFKPLVPVAKETRLRIYRVSPEFWELKPFLEGKIGAFWQSVGKYMQDDSNRHEILAGWFGWALRDAVSRAGYYAHGKYPDAYYSRLAREVNAACDQHLLDCYAPRPTFLAVWHNSYVRALLGTFGIKVAAVAGFSDVRVEPSSSHGTPQELAFFRAMTGDQIIEPQKYSLEIQAAAPNSEVQFQVKDPSGAPVPFTVSRAPSPDLFAYLIARNQALLGAANGNYLLAGFCTDQCSLEIRALGTLRKEILLADLKPSADFLESEGVIYRILSYAPPPVSPLREQARLEAMRLAALGAILRAYQTLHPIALLIALLTYELLTFNLLRRKEGGRTWIVLTGFGILCTSRIALVSYLHVYVLRLSQVAYLDEAYPIALAFIGLTCLVGLERLVSLGRRQPTPRACVEIDPPTFRDNR